MAIRSINILVRDCSGRTLLQFRDGFAKTFPLMWDFWGGRVSETDASPAHCAARELREELDIAASPEDFSQVGIRKSSTGQAWLVLYRQRVGWNDFRVCEGAGAAFFWRSEILRIPISKPIADHIRIDASLFADTFIPDPDDAGTG